MRRLRACMMCLGAASCGGDAPSSPLDAGTRDSGVSDAGDVDCGAPAETGVWIPMDWSEAPILSPDWDVPSVWTGSEMIVWDGRQGGRYDPTDDTWRPVSTVGSPLPRVSNPAVWTGAEMIVWGGDAEPGGNGDAYDPISDSWRALARDGAPADRIFHTAVWTGAEMIVWGGYDGDDVMATGGLYDPAADAWRATTEDGAPAARQYHTAVWTGSEMIVWGGYDGDDSGPHRFGSGARYDPVADAWTEMSSDGAPWPRDYHTAVWTGSEMIVWGGGGHDCGSGDAFYCASGGRYDPARDTWRATSEVGAFGRSDGTRALWTGSHMFIWGNPVDDSFDGVGSLYDPASDCWAMTPLLREPLQGNTIHYSYAAVVWADSAVVAWGGLQGGNWAASGGRYLPDPAGANCEASQACLNALAYADLCCEWTITIEQHCQLAAEADACDADPDCAAANGTCAMRAVTYCPDLEAAGGCELPAE